MGCIDSCYEYKCLIDVHHVLMSLNNNMPIALVKEEFDLEAPTEKVFGKQTVCTTFNAWKTNDTETIENSIKELRKNANEENWERCTIYLFDGVVTVCILYKMIIPPPVGTEETAVNPFVFK